MEERITSEVIYKGRIVTLRVDEVRLLPDRRVARREVVDHPGAVAVVPLTAAGEVVLVRQYRYAAGEALLEIPAGALERGENPYRCAERELLEETGRRAAALERLAAVFPSPGFCSELIHLYLARLEDGPADPQSPDEDENLEIVTIPLARALAMARAGRLRDAKTVAGLFLAAAREGQPEGEGRECP